MKFSMSLFLGILLTASPAFAETQITVYNQGFGVVKEKRALDLKKGENDDVRVTDITAHLEPDSVVLRDLDKAGGITVLEQDYESEPLTEALLLGKLEGKEISFEVTSGLNNDKKIIKGKILRSGYVPHYEAFQMFGNQYAYQQQAIASSSQPIVEVDGKLVFGLPGKPLFDQIDPHNFLKPTLLWKLDSASAGPHNVELSYITGGMGWEATYNLVAPENGDTFNLTAWVTLQNMTGKDFDDASVKLMAGDVARARKDGQVNYLAAAKSMAMDEAGGMAVREKSFDEFHLYNLPRPVTLLDREVKQVELLRSPGVKGQRIYVYDGADYNQYRGWNYDTIRQNEAYGSQSQKKVWSMVEFRNSKDSGLGMPLPTGTVKLYRMDSDGRPEFVGEDRIDHTPKDEVVRLYTGNSFDLVGERKRTAYFTDASRRNTEETFAIKVSNHKKDAVQIRVLEHMNRAENWEITQKSQDYKDIDSHTVEFPVSLAPDETKTVTYTVHYSW